MTYFRYEQTAYGPAIVYGENAFPQPPEPDHSNGLKKLREASNRIVAKQQECEDYKRKQRNVKERPPRDMAQIRMLKAMHRSMTLGGGPGEPLGMLSYEDKKEES